MSMEAIMQSYFFTNKPSLVLASLISLITLTGCGGGSSNTSTTPQLKGIWERVGYGDIIKIEENGGAVYQYTRATCLMSEALDGDEINEYLSDAEVTQQKLTIKNNYSFPVQYQKRAALPETCSDDALITSATPTESFEHLWHTFNDYYAFLNERNVDWENSYLAFKPMISDEMADEELFSVFANMLSVIDDGHVELESSENDYSPESIKGANRVVLEGFANQSEYDDIQEFASAYSNQYEQNLRIILG
ncbi:hypothetical protein GQR58_025966 [Nymphon striatum]|nr:hypothetical protein GQR58_025966 [Nymphon striatum]